MYNNIFDGHCHYDDEWFDDDRYSLVESLPGKGVCGVVTNGTDLENVKTVLDRSEEHTSELQSRSDHVCRLLLEKTSSSLIGVKAMLPNY